MKLRWLLLSLSFLCAGVVVAQMPLGGASAGDQISVMVLGKAEAPAEVVKVHLTVRNQEDTAELAALQNEDAVAKVLKELQKLGIAKESVEVGPSAVEGASLESMMKAAAGQEAGPRYSAAAHLTVTLTDVPQTDLPRRVGQIMDAAAVAGTALPGAGSMQAAMMGAMTGAGAPVTFEVKDPTALEQAALADGLKRAQAAAERVAQATGRQGLKLEGVSVLSGGFDWLGGVMRMFESRPAKPWRVEKSVTLLVSYSYQK